MINQIETILNQTVRPQLAVHRGNVEVLSFENQTVKIRLLGQCSGCPSAFITTEELIRKQLMEALPEIKDVFLVGGVSENLIEEARKFLRT